MKKVALLVVGLWLMAYLSGALAQVPVPLTPDTPIEGEISERGEVDAFSYEGEASQSITVSVTASVGSSLDTFLQILNPDGSPLAENDDAGDTLGATDSRLRVTLPVDGTYQILVSAFAGNSTGAYSLVLEVGVDGAEADAPPNVSPAPTEAAGLRLELGQATQASLEAGQQVTFIYRGRAGETIDIITTGEFDGVMQFFAPDERILGENDDDQSLMPALYGMVLPLDGDYTLLFFGYDETNFGPFSVTVEAAESYPLAQDAPLEFGAGRNGSLHSEEQATYVFSGTAGDVVTVQVVSQLDTTLALLDADMNVLIEDDDSGRGTNPLIRDFQLPADGDYSLRLSAYTSSMSGLYRIMLSRVILEDLPRLAIGEEINGTLALAEAVRYRFEGKAGQVITAGVTSEFDAFLTLRGPSWELLLEDDDTGGDFQPLLQSVRLPEDGLYTLIVTGFDNASQGRFTLRLSDDSIAPPSAPTPLITYGETLTGVLGPNGANFLFEGVTDDIVTIAVEGNFDSVLTLYDPEGRVVATDDDSGGGVNALLSNLALPADGQYLIELRAFDGQAGGEYRLRLTREENRTLGSGNSISYGENVQGRLFAGEPTVYTFLGQAGDSLIIEVEASFDAALELRDVQGVTLASDDDSGPGVNPRLENIVLPADGEYILLISAFDPNASGTFTVTIDAEQAAAVAQTLERGQKITGVLPLGGAVDYTFEGAVGDVISATALPTDITSDFDLYLELYRPDGMLLLADDDGGWRLNPAIVAASLPQTGTYTLRVQAYGGASEGEFLVSLQSGEVYISPSGEPAQRLTFDAEGSTSFSLTLPANGSALYLFEGVAGQTFTASQSGGVLDFFSIYSPDGTVEQQLENGVGFRIVTSTRYLFTVYTSQGGSGNFTLSLVPPSEVNIAQPPTSDAPPTASAPPVAEVSLRTQGEVAAGLPISAVLGTNEAHAWTFIPLYEGLYSVVLNAADPTQPYDPYLRLLDAEGKVLAEDDDSGGAFNALLEALTLEAGQTYTLEVRGFADQVGGAYFLAVIAQAVTLPPTVDGGALDIGIPITRRLRQPAQQAEFSLALAQAGTYTFTVAGLKLPYIDVLDAEGNLVARGAGTLAAQKLEAGAYTVRVYDRLNATGDFILIVGEKRAP